MSYVLSNAVEWSVAETGASAWEPVPMDVLRSHLRIITTAEDELAQLYAVAAREYIERVTNRCLSARTIVYHRRGFPCGRDFFELPRSPARSITSIAYTNTSQAAITVATSVYGLVTSDEPARVYLKPAQDWPGDVEDISSSLLVTYLAGPVSPAAVPRREMLAVLWLAAWWFEQRLPINVGNIVNPLPNHLDAMITQLEIHRAHP